jgi:hypothetical protein
MRLGVFVARLCDSSRSTRVKAVRQFYFRAASKRAILLLTSLPWARPMADKSRRVPQAKERNARSHRNEEEPNPRGVRSRSAIYMYMAAGMPPGVRNCSRTGARPRPVFPLACDQSKRQRERSRSVCTAPFELLNFRRSVLLLKDNNR